jgi:phage-related protein
MGGRADAPRPLIWRGASKNDFMPFPQTVQREMGFCPRRLRLQRSGRQRAERKPSRKCLPRGYTVRYVDAVDVLHAFQKKSKKGIATPKAEVDIVKKRLKDLIAKGEATMTKIPAAKDPARNVWLQLGLLRRKGSSQ